MKKNTEYYSPQTPEFSTTRNFPGVVASGRTSAALKVSDLMVGTPPRIPSTVGIWPAKEPYQGDTMSKVSNVERIMSPDDSNPWTKYTINLCSTSYKESATYFYTADAMR